MGKIGKKKYFWPKTASQMVAGFFCKNVFCCGKNYIFRVKIWFLGCRFSFFGKNAFSPKLKQD